MAKYSQTTKADYKTIHIVVSHFFLKTMKEKKIRMIIFQNIECLRN